MLSNLQRLISSSLAASTSDSFWFPMQGSTVASEIDWLFDFILWISIIFFVLIVGLMVGFIMSYRRRKGVSSEKTATHHTPLELTWTILPGILVVVIFYFGITGYLDMRTDPKDAREVLVTAQKWNWTFTYPNGAVAGDLHVPVDEPVRLVMRSEDVLHSFFVPAFRTKMDVVPGRYTKMWFNANTPGTYQVFCTEYCGAKHSGMLSSVIVHEPGGYERWLQEEQARLASKNPVELGADLYKTRGCMQCHSTDGTRGIGPSFKGLFGKSEQLADGSSAKVDEDYIRESVMEPQAKVTMGFAPVMPTFKGKLSDAEITGLIEYIKSLKE